MRKKIIGIFEVVLLIATALPAVGTMYAVEDKKIFPTHLLGAECSRIYYHESELFDDCNIQHVETLSQLYNFATYDDLDTFIIDAMDKYHIPGLSASIVKNDSFLFTRSYGYANISQDLFVEDTTLFKICSISKTITATAIMQLYEQGFFDLNDTINDYLPFQVNHPIYPSEDITFHMLLTHSSGIRDNWDVLPYYTGDSPNPLGTWLEDYLTPSGQYYKPIKNFWNWEPGTSWAYCNVAVALVGYLVEIISGTPFDEYCEINIFEPLDMDETSWFLADLDINHIAVPYKWNGYDFIPYEHCGWSGYPAGGLRTSVTQLRNFLLMYMNYGEYNSKQILSDSTVKLMLTPQLSSPNQFQGIMWLDYSDIGIISPKRSFWGHEGDSLGSRTFMLFQPETDIGVIVLTNGEPDFNDVAEITVALYEFADTETPYTPNIYGPPNGKVGTEYEYTFNAVDPNDDYVKYHIDWGDENFDNTDFSPSGTDVKVNHTWSKKGTYTIWAYAEDTDGFVSFWGALEVSMPKTKIYNPLIQLIMNTLQRFPFFGKILNHIIL